MEIKEYLVKKGYSGNFVERQAGRVTTKNRADLVFKQINQSEKNLRENLWIWTTTRRLGRSAEFSRN